MHSVPEACDRRSASLCRDGPQTPPKKHVISSDVASERTRIVERSIEFRRITVRLKADTTYCSLLSALCSLLPAPRSLLYGSANTYSAWPLCGILMSGAIAAGTLRGLPPPRPDITAMYCLPSDAVGHGEALHGCAQARFPQHLARLHVENVHAAIDVPDQHPPARGGQRRREERRVLLVLPHLVHRLHVVRRQLADVAVGAGHRQELAVARRCRRPCR